jgi:hypothetical protein
MPRHVVQQSVFGLSWRRVGALTSVDRALAPASFSRATREGKLYDSRFGTRMTGSGPYAWMIGRRFEAATARLGLGRSRVALRSITASNAPGRTIALVLKGRAKLGDVSIGPIHPACAPISTAAV